MAIKYKYKFKATLLVAITGGIACGKSTACEILKKSPQCLAVFDLDHINKELLEQQAVLIKMKSAFIKHNQQKKTPLMINFDNIFKNDAKNLSINKIALRELIFQQATFKKILEDLLHPLIFQTTLEKVKSVIKSQKNQASMHLKYIVIAIPLLKEHSPWLPLFDHIIHIYAPLEKRLAYLQARGLSSEISQQIIDQQPSFETYQKLADVSINNQRGIEELTVEILAWEQTIFSA